MDKIYDISILIMKGVDVAHENKFYTYLSWPGALHTNTYFDMFIKLHQEQHNTNIG